VCVWIESGRVHIPKESVACIGNTRGNAVHPEKIAARGQSPKRRGVVAALWRGAYLVRP
jgi:hypothetical protein